MTRRAAAETAVVNVLRAGLAFVAGVALARRFGETGRGELVAAMLWPSIAMILGNAGLNHGATFLIAQRPSSRARIVGTAATGVLVIGGLVAIITMWAVGPLLADQPPEVRDAARLFSLIVVIHPLLGALYHPWRVMDKVRRWNAFSVGVDSALFVALLITMAVGSKSYSLLMGAQVAILTGLTVLALMLWLRRGEGLRFDRGEIRPLLAYALPTLLATLPYFLNFRIDQAFLEASRSTAELGRYAVAVGWSLAVLPLLTTVNQLALPRIAGTGGHVAAAAHIRLGAVVGIGVALPLALIAPFAIPIVFGKAFEQSGWLALAIVPGTAILGFSGVVEEVLRSIGKPRLPLIGQGAGLVCMLSALPWASSTHGAWGAAGVSIASYAVAAGVLVSIAGRQLDTPARALLIPRLDELAALLRPRRRDSASVAGPG